VITDYYQINVSEVNAKEIFRRMNYNDQTEVKNAVGM
jgi:hypothetical protein